VPSGPTCRIAGFGEIADAYDVCLVDQWGVLHDGHMAQPEAVDVMQRLKAAGKQLVILSNSSRRVEATRRNMVRMEIDPCLFDGFVTSGEQVWQALSRRSDPFYAAFTAHCAVYQWVEDGVFLDGLDVERVDSIDAAELILLNGTRRDRPLQTEAIISRGVERGLPLVCTNSDLVVITPAGELVECPGAIARRYAALGGVVRWYGKPTPGAYRLALQSIDPGARVVAIGDSLYHDIGGAQAAGIDSLFISDGIHRPDLCEGGDGTHTCESLERVYRQHNVAPTYCSRRLVW